jgi:hypothetical protein
MPNDHDTDTMRARVLTSIEKQGIIPKPRWHFLLREWVVWLVALLAFVIGSIASALSIYIADSSRFMEHAIELSNLDVLFEVIPFIWLVLLGLAVFYSVHALRETRKGYHFHTSWLVLLAVVASVGMGSVLQAQGIGAALDRYLLAEAPFYPPISGFQPAHWMRSQDGVIAGVVIEMGTSSFTMHALDGKEWVVTRSTSTVSNCPPGEDQIGEGVRVRMIGTSTGEGTYEAYEVCQFHGRGGPQSGPRPMGRSIKNVP